MADQICILWAAQIAPVGEGDIVATPKLFWFEVGSFRLTSSLLLCAAGTRLVGSYVIARPGRTPPTMLVHTIRKFDAPAPDYSSGQRHCIALRRTVPRKQFHANLLQNPVTSAQTEILAFATPGLSFRG